AIAVGQLVDQYAALGSDLAHLPLAAAVEHAELAILPAPFAGQALQKQALPALGATASRWTADLLVHLQIQAAADQLESFQVAPRAQVLLKAAVDDDVGVEFVEVQTAFEDRLLAAQRQAFDLRVLAGVDLGEQQLERGLVRRLDARVQLPHAGTDEFFRRNACQMAKVEHILGAYETLAQQDAAVILIARLLVDRHQPPDRCAPAEPDGGAVELVEQQVVLGRAAVIGGQLRLARTLGETLRVDQEHMHFGAQGGCPA